MKKLLVLILSLVLMAQVLPAAFAAEPAQVTVSSATAQVGELVTVRVSVKNAPDAKSIYLVPKFDASALELVSGKWLVEGLLADDYNPQFGDAVIAFGSNTPINKAVFEMVFRVKGSGSTKVSCDIVIKTQKGQSEVPVTLKVTGGQIALKQTAMQGDANGDRRVNYLDALMILRHSIGQKTLAVTKHLDMNGDNRVNYADALSILRKSIGIR